MTISRSQRRATNKLAAALIVLVTGLTSASAFAGDVLHFKSGDVRAPAFDAHHANQLTASQATHYVVQFKSHIRAEDRQDIMSLGAQILRYIPDDALIVRSTPAIALTIARSMTSIQAVIPFSADWKIDPAFAPVSVFTAKSLEAVFIRLFDGENLRLAELQLGAIPGVQLVDVQGRSIVAKAERAQLAQIAQVAAVEWVQPNPKFELLDMKGLTDPPTSPVPNGNYTDLTGFESGGHLLNVEAVWAKGFTGKGQIASMADTGLDSGDVTKIHQDFTGRIPTGLIFGMFSKSWEDPMGHGTHVSGSVFGSGAASGGRLKGSAYEAQYIPESMWSPMLSGLSVPPKLGDLFTQAYAAGARIHTNSWGAASSVGSYDNFAQQVDEFAAANPEMLILFAAGNSGVDADKDGRVDPNSICSPGTAKNVLTVGASKNLILTGGLQKKLSETKLAASWPVEPLASSMLSENAQGIAAFSSRGPTADGRLKPEVVSPGTNILSVHSQVTGADPLWGLYNQDYAWSGGTSMATPVTAGAATIVRQYLVEDRKLAHPSSALMKAVLMHTATDLFPGEFGAIGKDKGQEILTTRPNNDEGYGRVNADAATSLASAILVDEAVGLATGEKHSYPLHISGDSNLTATMVYTDAAAADGAASALVNDLDLVLVDPSGQETTLGDHVNNAEMLQTAVHGGDYKVEVRGTNVPQGPMSGKQAYALVLSVH